MVKLAPNIKARKVHALRAFPFVSALVPVSACPPWFAAAGFFIARGSMRNATAAEVGEMLKKALDSGLKGERLPGSDLRFNSEQILYINTVYEEARNRTRPCKASQPVRG